MYKASGWGVALAAVLLWCGATVGLAGEPVAKEEKPGSGSVVPAAGKPAPEPAKEESGPEHGKLNTADASPVDPGHFEVEAGYSYSRARRFWDGARDLGRRKLTREHCTSLTVTAGVFDDFDLNLSSCYAWVRDDENDYDEDDNDLGPRHGDHFGDLEFGGRYRFVNDGSLGLELAYIAGFTAPTGSHDCRDEIGTTQEFWSLNQSLVATKDWGRWTTNAEAGYSLPFGEHRDDSRGVLGLNLATGYQILDWLQPELEINFEREYVREDCDPYLVSGTAGFIMAAGENMGIKLGVQEGLWGRNADQATSLVLVLKWAF